MKQANIKFVLVQIDEAHSTAWPIGLENTPEPQKNFEERVKRAINFIQYNDFGESFIFKIDAWENHFAETFRAWPDKYYLIDKEYRVLEKSEYGTENDEDAKIKTDCCELICKLVDKNKIK